MSLIDTAYDIPLKTEAVTIKKKNESASAILDIASETIKKRASDRDTESERAMLPTVTAFNAIFGKDITEEQGWQFMTILKMCRSNNGRHLLDDYIDGAAYFALAGEASAKQLAESDG